MRAKDIPFVELVGVKQSGDALFLEYEKKISNHLKTIHAGAQYTLAETASGLYLQELFPDLVGKVVPILRESNIKYKKPALTKIKAFASVDDASKEKFNEQFEKKGRALLEVSVEVVDADSNVVANASFVWFVQKI